MPPMLIKSQPRLQRLRKHRLANKVYNLTDNNQDKRNRIHPMDMQMEHLDTNRHAPKRAREQRNVEERRGTQAEQHGCERVEEREDERVAS